MTTNKKILKIKLVAMMIAIFMLFSSTSVALFGIAELSKNILFAYETKIDISNSNFENPNLTSGSTMPGTPTSWTALNKIDGVTAGVISLDTDIATEDVIQKKYKLENWIPSYLNMPDMQVLMINSENFATYSGYRSPSVDFQKGSYYVIQFMAYTEADSNASAKLTGADALQKDDYIFSINTNAAWRQYRFYVKANALTSISVSLELWLGNENKNTSKGAVFFDNISVKSYDQASFITSLNNDIDSHANYKYINLDQNYVPATEFVANPSFESPLGTDNWTLSEKTNLVGANKTINGIYSVENFNKTDTKVQDDIENTNIYGNKNALLINNLENGFVAYNSSYFTANKNTLYRLSFLVKTSSNNGGTKVKLLERNPYTNEFLSNGSPNPYYYENSSYEEKEYAIESISTNDYSNEATNNWKEYYFIIKTSPLVDIELCIEISVDGLGYALFDNFALMKITSSEYSSSKDGGTEINLDQFNAEMDFANGNFNLVSIEDVSDTYPYKPQNWTLNASDANASALNGIINTSENVAGVPIIPALNNAHPNNNVLMIGNLTSNNQKYTNSGKTVESGKYARISFDVLTTELSNAKASFKVVCDDIVLGEIANIDTNNVWQHYSILLKTGFEEKTIKVELCLGEKSKGTGFAFFDNVNYEEIEASVYADDTETKKIDLLKADFTNISDENNNGIYTPYDYTPKFNNSGVTAGVIDTSKYGLPDGYNSSSLENPGHPENENNNVLMIKSNSDVYYAYASNMKYKLESGKYYQITVKVKTQNVAQDEENKQYKDSNNQNAYPYGASINLDGIDGSFVGISTDGEWKTYTIYINNTSENEISVELGLGSENAKTKGTVYYSSAEIKNIEQSEYLSGIEVLENENVDNVLAIGNTDKIEENEDENKDEKSSVQFDWLVVPSLIFGLVILFAVGAVLYRNIKKKSHKKVSAKEYSRDNLKNLSNSNKSRNRDLSQRKAKLLERQNAVAVMINEQRRIDTDESKANVEKLEKEYAEINKKLADLEKEKKKANKEYKQKKTELKAKKKATK